MKYFDYNIVNKNSKDHASYNRGQAVITAVIFFLFTSMAIVFGATGPIIRDVRAAGNLLTSKESFYLAEAGTEDVLYRIKNRLNVSDSESVLIGSSTVSVSVSSIGSGKKEILAEGNINNFVRKNKIVVNQGAGADFFYGIQSGEGGFFMNNSSTVTGSVFSNGDVVGQNSNIIKGDVVSAGPSGLIDGIHATGTARAHTIDGSVIDKDAYYQIINSTVVWGTTFPGSSDQATSSLPISDQDIEEWKQFATTTVISSPCPYEITSDLAIGPARIACDLKISGSPTVTLRGTIWVEGNIEIENSVVMQIDPSLGDKSLAVIADKESNRLTSSKISIENSSEFHNSGTYGSYILFISQNNSAENGGDEEAIKIKNSASGDLLVYAGHGEISIENNASLKEVTGYKITLKNSANVVYETGLGSLLFDSGVSGGWNVESWEEK